MKRTNRTALRLGVLTLLLMLSGCTSIPISTMWAMRDFDLQTFASLDARVLRTAILTEQDVRFDPADVTLDLSLRLDEGEPTSYTPSMQAERLSTPSWPGLDDAPDGFHWIVMQLSDDGAREFQRFQRDMAQVEKGTMISLQFNFGLPSAQTTRTTPFEVEFWLRTEVADGWRQLMRRRSIDPTDPDSWT